MANEKPSPSTPAPVPAKPEPEPTPQDVETPVEKPEHDPETVVVEHNPDDPNAPNYQGAPTAEKPAQSV